MTNPRVSDTAVPADLMSRLREATAEAHRKAEARPLMRAIARGTVAPARFTTHLEQLLLVHRLLERELERAVLARPGWAALAPAERRRVGDLEADLQLFGGTLTPHPLPATVEALAGIERATALALLGMFYVTEGSTNGGHILAKPVARALGRGDARLRSFDPYGDRQREMWAAFKTAMNAIRFSPDDVQAIEAGAREMFDRLGEMADAVAADPPA
jgi:heme oxygenase